MPLQEQADADSQDMQVHPHHRNGRALRTLLEVEPAGGTMAAEVSGARAEETSSLRVYFPRL